MLRTNGGGAVGQARTAIDLPMTFIPNNFLHKEPKANQMKINRILCPIDYSNYSKAANFYASLFAQASGGEIIYLNVNWPPNNEPIASRLDDLYARLSTHLRPFAHGVSHRFEVRDGDPAEQILALANEESVDLIVMGTHGETGLTRLLNGSVCGKVLRKAKCPVMAVKDALNIGWIVDSSDQRLVQDQAE